MTTVGVRELSNHTGRYLAQVKSGRTVVISERGRIIAVLSPAGEAGAPPRPRPRIGGYRSAEPPSAEEIDAALARGFGTDDRR